MKEYEIKSKEQIEIIDKIMKSKETETNKIYYIKSYLLNWISNEEIEKTF